MKIKVLLLSLLLVGSFQTFGQICAVDAGSNVSICTGDSTPLMATVSDPTKNYRYFWSPAAGLSDSTIANPVAKPLATTIYSVKITDTDTIELVANGDFSQGNVGFNSDYKDSVSVWNRGTFRIVMSPQTAHPGFSQCADHTSSNGFMMVVNGSNIPNEIVWEQTINVVPFTTYEYSTWVTNVVSTVNLPKLQFSINGKLIGPVFSSLPTPCDWNQFFTTWYSDTATIATITIINQSTAGIGNDFAIDDISFRAICLATDSVTVHLFEEYDPLVDGLGADAVLCDANPMTLSTSIPGATNFVWQDNSTASSYTTSNGGIFSVSLLDGNGCDFVDTISITASQSPQVTLPSDTTICEDNIVSFNVYDPSASAYLWRGPSVYFLQNDPTSPEFTATFEGVYEVDVTNGCGTLTQLIELKTIDCSCSPFVPNAFTPNNDGDNDELFIFTGCTLEDVRFSIFDRWGERVFATDDINVGWDGLTSGSLAPSGTYVYRLEYRSENFKGEVVPSIEYGDIILLR
jgi:gliding motility-associated-like protein